MKTPLFEIPCVILSGGKSSRMGEDKALLPFSNYSTLAQYQYERLKPHFKKTYISSKTNKFDFEANLILDKDSDIYSPIIALKTIFETLKDEKKIFIITVDTPFVKLSTMEELVSFSSSNDIVIPETQKTHNLCGVFDKSCLLFIYKMIDKDIHKVNYLLKNSKTKVLKKASEEEFINLNDKIQYELAKKHL